MTQDASLTRHTPYAGPSFEDRMATVEFRVAEIARALGPPLSGTVVVCCGDYSADRGSG